MSESDEETDARGTTIQQEYRDDLRSDREEHEP